MACVSSTTKMRKGITTYFVVPHVFIACAFFFLSSKEAIGLNTGTDNGAAMQHPQQPSIDKLLSIQSSLEEVQVTVALLGAQCHNAVQNRYNDPRGGRSDESASSSWSAQVEVLYILGSKLSEQTIFVSDINSALRMYKRQMTSGTAADNQNGVTRCDAIEALSERQIVTENLKQSDTRADTLEVVSELLAISNSILSQLSELDKSISSTTMS